ncbi:MAG: family 10 glycosylhydrolase, partial [Armatimonadetes bacterium]|nr:family 10 glycosylhydrolase [Armatimonadota bacterium]
QLRHSQTTARYGLGAQDEGAAWLQGLNCQVQARDETQLVDIPGQATVVLHAQYLLDEATAEWLASFVRHGGHALFVDGPVFAIRHPALQDVLGMAGTAEYFSELRAINPAPGQDLLPEGPPVDLELERRRADCWAEFWTDSVTDLVRQVYRGAKAMKPKAWVSAAVFYNKKAADNVCQDWYGWLLDGIIDYVLPMAYTDDNRELESALQEWRAFDPGMARIIPGLSIYSKQGQETVPRHAELIRAQQALCASYGVHGNCYFALDYLTPELQVQFATQSYAEITEPYYPQMTDD